MPFLNTGRIVGRHYQRQIADGLDTAAIFAEQANSAVPFFMGQFQRLQDIRGIAAGRNSYYQIARHSQRFNLTTEDIVKTLIVTDSGQNRGIG